MTNAAAMIPAEFDPTALASHPALQSDRGLLIAGVVVVLGIAAIVGRVFLADRQRMLEENSRLTQLMLTQVGELAKLVATCQTALEDSRKSHDKAVAVIEQNTRSHDNAVRAQTQFAAMLTARERKMSDVMMQDFPIAATSH